MDQDSTFMSSLMTYLFQRLDIKIKTIAPFNHQSLQVEHGIKSLTCILTKHLNIVSIYLEQKPNQVLLLNELKVSRNTIQF